MGKKNCNNENLIFCPICGDSVLYGKLCGITVTGEVVKDQHRCNSKKLAAIDKAMQVDAPRARKEPSYSDRLEIAYIMNDDADTSESPENEIVRFHKKVPTWIHCQSLLHVYRQEE